MSPSVLSVDEPFDLLSGTTILEFGDDLAGSIAAYHLALLGATVYLLEPPEGCWLRRVRAEAGASGNGALFACFGRGKRSVALADALASPEAVWNALDVVIEPVRRGLELPLACRAGAQGGPMALSFREDDGSRFTELSAQAAFGLSAYLGRREEAPLRVGFEVLTYSAAVLAVQSVLAALPLRKAHGLSQRLRVPVSRVAASILNNVTTASVEPDQEVGFSRGWASSPYYGIPCSDGEVEILFYGPRADEGWRQFCERAGMPQLGADPRFSTYRARTQFAGDVGAAVAPVTSTMRRDVLLQLLWDCGAMAVPRWGVDEAAASEQAAANGLVLSRPAEEAFQLLASPWALDGQRASLRSLPALADATAEFGALGGRV